jgi:hypothetical protein
MILIGLGVVVFCDLVGSTPLSAGLDPEDLRAVIGAYHRSVAALIEAPPRRAAGGRDHYSGGVVMDWRLCTDAAAYEAALSRTFGAAAPPTDAKRGLRRLRPWRPL